MGWSGMDRMGWDGWGVGGIGTTGWIMGGKDGMGWDRRVTHKGQRSKGIAKRNNRDYSSSSLYQVQYHAPVSLCIHIHESKIQFLGTWYTDISINCEPV